MRRALWILLIAAVVLAISGVVFLREPLRQVDVGTGYVAKQMCSCVHLGQRNVASCRPDIPPSMDAIELEALPGGDGFQASVPLLSTSIARFAPANGCVLER